MTHISLDGDQDVENDFHTLKQHKRHVTRKGEVGIEEEEISKTRTRKDGQRNWCDTYQNTRIVQERGGEIYNIGKIW